MNFQNSYISIFRIGIKPKLFVSISIVLIVFLLFVSFLLHMVDLTINENDVIRKYQLSKIKSIDKNISTIIVGDSSGGNAINAKYFSKLTGLKTENLCLTGEWGILGSLGIAKKVTKKNGNIKNIIIIQTLDIWGREYPKESMIELFPADEIQKNINLSEIFSYFFNLKEIKWHIKYVYLKYIFNTTDIKIDSDNDYTLQSHEKYSNGLKKIRKGSTLNGQIISDAKIIELDMIQNFCSSNNLNCIFAHGPIHEEIKNNSEAFLDYMGEHIKNKFRIHFINKIFSYENYKLGNTDDHIDVKYKNDVTHDYYLEIKEYLK